MLHNHRQPRPGRPLSRRPRNGNSELRFAPSAGLDIPKDPPREVKKWLNPSPLIESTNAKVRALARELPAGKETAWEQVQAILAGVREKVKYEVDPKDIMKGAIGALRDGKADR